MSYDAEVIANAFIRMAEEAGNPITAMQLQKLLYFAQGWNLAFTRTPLLKQRLEAWEYGPVVEDVYHAFKHLGADDLRSNRACRREGHWNGRAWRQDREVGSEEVEPLAPEDQDLLREVYATYGKLSGPHLSGMTHVEGGPWKRFFKKGQNVWINDNDLMSYFEDCLKTQRAY